MRIPRWNPKLFYLFFNCCSRCSKEEKIYKIGNLWLLGCCFE